MSYNGTIHVIDKTGWSKTFPLEKALTMIGSATFNDIVLSDDHGSGVAAVHLQLISTQNERRSFRLINLVNETLSMVLSNASGKVIIPAKGSRELQDGDAIQLGDFKITFYLQAVNGLSIEKRSQNIGLLLEMPGITVKEGKILIGLLTVKNYGQEKRCQFEVDLEGLPSDCYQIDPAPLLFAGGEEKLQIRFFHQGIRPTAGDCPIQLRVTAVSAYPTEEVLLPLVLSIEPVYRYKVEIIEEKDKVKEAMEVVVPIRFTPTEIEMIEGNLKEEEKQTINESADLLNSQQIHQITSQESDINEKSTQTTVEVVVEEEVEGDWWADQIQPLRTTSNSDPLADLKRGKSKLTVPKSKVQVLKATAEDEMESENE
ncbi:MAG: FHA domain-containing protein [Anaerolineaceae bacterium]|nr:FHA domain-containing protein [Anaerolineaceae bacterium]